MLGWEMLRTNGVVDEAATAAGNGGRRRGERRRGRRPVPISARPSSSPLSLDL